MPDQPLPTDPNLAGCRLPWHPNNPPRIGYACRVFGFDLSLFEDLPGGWIVSGFVDFVDLDFHAGRFPTAAEAERNYLVSIRDLAQKLLTLATATAIVDTTSLYVIRDETGDSDMRLE